MSGYSLKTSRKRRNTSSPECDGSPAPKRRRSSSPINSRGDVQEQMKQRPQIDPYSGQASAFPGIDTDGDEMFYGPAADGVEYLRMVRSEAKGVPDLLVAAGQNQSCMENGVSPGKAEDSGYYHGGAYTAKPVNNSKASEQITNAQKLYYDSLLAQFRLLQATVRCIPPLSEVQKLDSSRPISFPPDSKIARQQWEKHILQNFPHPVQVACMDSETVVELVKFMRRKLMLLLKTSGVTARKTLAPWVWVMLGRCRDLGELVSEEVGELRALAQKAIDILDTTDAGTSMEDERRCDLTKGLRSSLEEVSAEVASENSQIVAMSIEDTDLGVEAERSHHVSNFKVVLDMIITVVGEIYGQRDLLESREIWRRQ